ncbi:4'-phosphopantetheinyl transferase [Winogradskya consettensis]|uniref:4'-phosphopantetheinyl transferase n=1 Tax=Winogradskya consettensis TaxID=113560 RepID=A0A919SWR3_9ACTN|nr:4'-phosphopantetheinyl transferase superfamily protein [Actinoplanes consettensis]GIM79760.1 4'-phosphopantetheinyl transferase [Actinoplanes consettensis]
MIERLLPPTIQSRHSLEDKPESTLLPGEEDLIANAVPKRRAEFTTARWCAREAMGKLGVAPAPILRGERGAPIWPTGIVGSMTHCLGFRAAAVALSTDIAGVGIDAEVHDKLPEGVLDLVSLPSERTHLAQLSAGWPDVWWERLLFSAKESVYKVWFPQTGEWLGFEEAALTFSPESGTFTAALLRNGPFKTLHGKFLVEDGFVLTAIVLEHAPGQADRP